MVNKYLHTLAGLLLLFSSPLTAADKFNIRGLLELQLFNNESARSWTRGGFSKSRFDKGSTPVQPGKAGIHIDYHLTDILWFRSLTSFDVDTGIQPQLIETYLNYRPVPRGGMRIRAKLGVFHIPLSNENRDVAWSGLYSMTPSVINTWVGEELRTIGAEATLSWPGRFRDSANDYSLTAGIFGFNDGAGTELAYRGWANHDRQTGLGERLRLPSQFTGQNRGFEPFREIDDQPGYYLGGSWRYQRAFQLKVFHYNNRADASAHRNGQNAWKTRFNQLSLEWKLPNHFKFIGQYMSGKTRIDNRVTAIVSDVNFSASYLLLTRLINKHRISFRYEIFDVDDEDSFTVPIHNSNETGRSWTLSYHYDLNKHWRLAGEWLNIDSKRADRRGIEGVSSELESQILFSLRYKFSI